MDKRENLLRLLRRQGYEFAPVEFALCEKLENDYRKFEKTDEDYRDYFQMDWRNAPPLMPDNTDLSRFLPYHGGSLDTWTTLDEWGVGHRKTPSSMHMSQMLFPLKDADSVEQIQSYPMPTYTSQGNPHLREEVEALHRRGLASMGNMQCTVWETSWYMRGMENLMMDMMSEDEMAQCLLDRVTQISLDKALLYARAGVDMLFLGDDIGMQRTLLMSRELYRTWIQPRLKKIISAVKAERPEILILYHSCGYIQPIIPDLIDAGIDVLNPVQPECMDFEEIHREFGDVLSFTGTIGTQTVMPFGTPEEVREAVWKNLRIAGPKGGLLACPTHLLEPEVPWENIRAYVEACRSFQG